MDGRGQWSQTAAEDHLDVVDGEVPAVADGHAAGRRTRRAGRAPARTSCTRRWWWSSSTFGSTRTLPVPRSSTRDLAERLESCTVWYTVFSEIVGISARAAVVQRLDRRVPTISLKTVYQTVHDLEALGEVGLLDLGTGSVRVDPNVEHRHHHLVCTSCGLVRDVPRRLRRSRGAGPVPPGVHRRRRRR